MSSICIYSCSYVLRRLLGILGGLVLSTFVAHIPITTFVILPSSPYDAQCSGDR